MGLKLIHTCNLCGTENERVNAPTALTINKLKPEGWVVSSQSKDKRTGEESKTLYFCSQEHKDAYNVAWQHSFEKAEGIALTLFAAEFQKAMNMAKLKSRNAVDALAGLADDLEEDDV